MRSSTGSGLSVCYIIMLCVLHAIKSSHFYRVYSLKVFFISIVLLTSTLIIVTCCSVLEKLILVTDRECDRGEGKVSPVYLAVLSGQTESLRPLLREGYSPDAQSCREFGYCCPLNMALWCNSWKYEHI